jgi:putative tryptophan/tyrosine transport system substrate-binding protein
MMFLMRRREFIAALGSAAAWSVGVRAEESPKLWRIGLLETIPPELNTSNLGGLRRGLHDLGYDEGRNYVFEYRSADGHSDQFPRLAAELVTERVDLIVTRGTPATRAAKTATSTTPIVMASVGEALGTIQTLAHPGGNVIGMSAFTTGLAAKRVELLKELLPAVTRVAYLHNMNNPVAPMQWEQTATGARKLGVSAELYDVHTRDEVVHAIEEASAKQTDALFVGNDSITEVNRALIAELAVRNHLPSVFGAREFVDAGGLMNYSTDYSQMYYESARLIDKIFHGAKAGDLPVQQPTKFALVINLKTAQALGISVPQTLLARADEVIE